MINYLSNKEKNNLKEKITVISEPLLSVNSNGDIDGFFAINYNNFIKKRSLLGWTIRDADRVGSILNFSTRIRESLSIKVYRAATGEADIVIYDSNFSEQGYYYEKSNLNSKQTNNPAKSKIKIGFLNVVGVDKNILNTNSENTIIEFYNFTDMDYKKEPNKNYRYKIEVTMKDPTYDYLNEAVELISEAYLGSYSVGLAEILSYIETIKNQKGTSQDSNSKIIEYIQKRDQDLGTSSLVETPRGFELVALKELFQNNKVLRLFRINPATAKDIYVAINNMLNLEDYNSASINLISYLINNLQIMRENLGTAINGISNPSVSKQSFGVTATGVSSINGNSNKRLLSETTTSKSHVKILNYGFNYLSSFSSNDGMGLKQVVTTDLHEKSIDMLSKYYTVSSEDTYSPSLRSFKRNFLYTNMLLSKNGVVLPEGLIPKDLLQKENSWSILFKMMLLFIDLKGGVSKDIMKLENVYKQGFQEIKELDISVDLLNSLEKETKQLAQKGMDIVVESEDKFLFLETQGEIQTDQTPSSKFSSVELAKPTNVVNYFASFVNNLEENKNSNSSLGFVNKTTVNNTIENLEMQTIPAICLIEYLNAVPTEFGHPEKGVSFEDYYLNRVWSSTGQLFLDQYGDFFFNFVNTAKIEYLAGFDIYTLKNNLAQQNKSDVGMKSYLFKDLTNSVIEELESGKALLCKMSDYIPEAFSDSNRALMQKLKFFNKYYNYFLIIKGRTDLQIKTFGSSV